MKIYFDKETFKEFWFGNIKTTTKIDDYNLIGYSLCLLAAIVYFVVIWILLPILWPFLLRMKE